jgi:hypothetical protein
MAKKIKSGCNLKYEEISFFFTINSKYSPKKCQENQKNPKLYLQGAKKYVLNICIQNAHTKEWIIIILY